MRSLLDDDIIIKMLIINKINNFNLLSSNINIIDNDNKGNVVIINSYLII